MIKMGVDMSEAYAATGFIEQLATSISTERYIDSVTEYTHMTMAKAFDEYVDPIAAGNRTGFNHVYEPDLLGIPAGRLWKHRLQGGGRYTSIASFKFLPSTHNILTPEERSEDKDDRMYHVSSEVIAKLSKRRYVFTSRATVMEYGLPTVVAPRYSRLLFVPTLRQKGNFMLTRHPTPQNWTRANPQDSSGGAGTQGRFTALWTAWWSNSAPRLWDSHIKDTIEGGLGKSERELMKVTKGRRRGKTFKMGVFDAKADYEAGSNMAKAFISGQTLSYERASNYIDRNWS